MYEFMGTNSKLCHTICDITGKIKLTILQQGTQQWQCTTQAAIL